VPSKRGSLATPPNCCMVRPVHLERNAWTKSTIRELLRPGQFLFVEKAFYYRTIRETNDNQHRRCRTFARKIDVEFFVDTRDMFGTTSMTVSFAGHQTSAALLQLKSLEDTAHGWLRLHCTSFALGVGFSKDALPEGPGSIQPVGS
jgi:hypothetical protein